MNEGSRFEEGGIIQTKGDPVPQSPAFDSTQDEADPMVGEEEFSEAAPHGTPQHFSTPARVGLLEYKSFFNVECERIVHQLREGCSASKRKLHQLDLSSIEAEPPPFYCTPNSVLDVTTHHTAKWRRIEDQGDGFMKFGLHHPETRELHFYFSQHKHNPVCQSLGASADGFSRLSSAAPRRKLFQKMRRSGIVLWEGGVRNMQQVENEEAFGLLEGPVLRPRSHLPCPSSRTSIDQKNPAPDLERSTVHNPEFRSFFQTECEAICNWLKRRDTKRPADDVSTIDAEPPPNLSSNITFLSELDCSHAKVNSCFGVSQLDLEKMNFGNQSVTDGGLSIPKPSTTVSYSDKATGVMNVTVVSATKDMGNVHGGGIVADITKDIVTMHEVESVAGATQDIWTKWDGVSAVDVTQAIGITIDGVLAVDATQDIWTSCVGVKAADVTQDMAMCDEVYELKESLNVITAHGKMSIANVTQEIVVNVTKDIEMEHNISVANATQDILQMCNENHSNATPNIALHGADAERNSVGGRVSLANDDVTAHDEESPVQHTLNATATHFTMEPKRMTMTLPSTMCTIRIPCALSAGGSTPDTETYVESGTTLDIVTIHRKENMAEAAQDGISNVPIAQKSVLIGGHMNIPKRACSAMKVETGIKNTTFLCTERKPDQNGVTVGYTRNVVHIGKESLSASRVLPISPINPTITIKDLSQGSTGGSTTSTCWGQGSTGGSTPSICVGQGSVGRSAPSTCWGHGSTGGSTPSICVGQGSVGRSAPSTCVDQGTEIVNQKVKECNKRPLNTEDIAANCTLLNIVPQVAQPKLAERGSRRISLVCPMDSTCDLDGTYIVNEESVFCKGPFAFMTSTPLPGANNLCFIKKSSGGSEQSNPKVFLHKEEKQMAIPKLVSSINPAWGNITQIRGQFSQDFSTPCPSKGPLLKVEDTSRLPKPAMGIAMLRHPATSTTAKKIVQTTRPATSDKVPVAPSRTNRIPADTPTGLPRRNDDIAQNSTANRIPIDTSIGLPRRNDGVGQNCAANRILTDTLTGLPRRNDGIALNGTANRIFADIPTGLPRRNNGLAQNGAAKRIPIDTPTGLPRGINGVAAKRIPIDTLTGLPIRNNGLAQNGAAKRIPIDTPTGLPRRNDGIALNGTANRIPIDTPTGLPRSNNDIAQNGTANRIFADIPTGLPRSNDGVGQNGAANRIPADISTGLPIRNNGLAQNGAAKRIPIDTPTGLPRGINGVAANRISIDTLTGLPRRNDGLAQNGTAKRIPIDTPTGLPRRNDGIALNGTANRIPIDTPTGLPRSNNDIAQNGTANRIFADIPTGLPRSNDGVGQNGAANRIPADISTGLPIRNNGLAQNGAAKRIPIDTPTGLPRGINGVAAKRIPIDTLTGLPIRNNGLAQNGAAKRIPIDTPTGLPRSNNGVAQNGAAKRIPIDTPTGLPRRNDGVAQNGTANRIFADIPTGLPRSNDGIGQNGAANRIPADISTGLPIRNNGFAQNGAAKRIPIDTPTGLPRGINGVAAKRIPIDTPTGLPRSNNGVAQNGAAKRIPIDTPTGLPRSNNGVAQNGAAKRIPIDTPTGLPRRNDGVAQNGSANRIPQKGLANCFRAGKGSGIK
ncbi:uncharacterized protein ACMZJ9_022244, partial [Mantella aurantiaca]